MNEKDLTSRQWVEMSRQLDRMMGKQTPEEKTISMCLDADEIRLHLSNYSPPEQIFAVDEGSFLKKGFMPGKKGSVVVVANVCNEAKAKEFMMSISRLRAQKYKEA